MFFPLPLFLFLSFIYLFWESEREREREREYEWGSGRERGRGNSKQALCCQFDEGLKLTNPDIMTRAEIKSQKLNWLSHTGISLLLLLNFFLILALALVSLLQGIHWRHWSLEFTPCLITMVKTCFCFWFV